MILRDHRVEGGFDTIHIRKRIREPLPNCALTIAEVAQAVGSEARGFGFRGDIGLVAGGFCLPMTDALVYGIEKEGVVKALGVRGVSEALTQKLQPLTRKHRLVLVNWGWAQKIE